jgi:hypothetical protein
MFVQLPQTGVCPYSWVVSPSGDAEADGQTMANTKRMAGSAAVSLAARMANMFARNVLRVRTGTRAETTQ